MFCPFCGTKVMDGASFCTNCGKNLAGAAQQAAQYQAQKEAIRNSESTALYSAIQHFSAKTAQFDEYDRLCTDLNEFAKGTSNALIVWGAILFHFGITLTLGLLSDGTEGGAAGAAVFALLFALPGLLMILGGILIKVNHGKKYRRALEQYAALSRELLEHYNGYPNCLVGPEYSNPRILAAVYQTLRSGRADTVKESLNLVIAGCDKRRLGWHLQDLKKSTADVPVGTVFMPSRFFR